MAAPRDPVRRHWRTKIHPVHSVAKLRNTTAGVAASMKLSSWNVAMYDHASGNTRATAYQRRQTADLENVIAARSRASPV